MGISYSPHNLKRFNETALVPIKDQNPDGISCYTGAYTVGNLSIHGLEHDCTTLHINNATRLFCKKDNTGYEPVFKQAQQALTEIKRFMFYSGKNTAILTMVCQTEKGHYAYCDDREERIKELGLTLVAKQVAGRSKNKTKYTCILLVDPIQPGYDCLKITDFTQDPWYKERNKK